MKSNARTREKSNVRPRHVHLGLDLEGMTHHWSIADDLVLVFRLGEVHHRVELDERSIDEWIEFVGENRGWIDRNYFATAGDWLANAVEVETDS